MELSGATDFGCASEVDPDRLWFVGRVHDFYKCFSCGGIASHGMWKLNILLSLKLGRRGDIADMVSKKIPGVVTR